MGTIRLRLKEVAKAKKMTGTDLMYETRISRQTISHYMQPEVSYINLDFLARLAKALDVKIGELIEITED